MAPSCHVSVFAAITYCLGIVSLSDGEPRIVSERHMRVETLKKSNDPKNPTITRIIASTSFLILPCIFCRPHAAWQRTIERWYCDSNVPRFSYFGTKWTLGLILKPSSIVA